jgi:hypothetical protein
MKTILTLLIAGALCVTGRATTNAMLCGIRVVETQDQPHPPRGKLGERGPYQFRRSTWRMHTSSSFDLAENREVANTIARRHYVWIEATLRANGIEPSPYNVALAWNAGVNAVIRRRAPAASHDYATRVLNVACTILDRKAPVQKTKPAWRAPILMEEETVASTQETSATSQDASAPETVPTAIQAPVDPSPVTNVVSAESPAQSDPVEVRFHSDPILLAFCRSRTPEPAKDTLPIPLEVVANASLVAERPRTTPHLQLLALLQNMVPGASLNAN